MQRIKKSRINKPDADGLYLFNEFVVLVNAGKIKILSRKCTHLGCRIIHFDNKLICPCHGSEFSQGGNLIKGPAEKDLVQLDFTVKDNSIIEVMIEE